MLLTQYVLHQPSPSVEAKSSLSSKLHLRLERRWQSHASHASLSRWDNQPAYLELLLYQTNPAYLRCIFLLSLNTRATSLASKAQAVISSPSSIYHRLLVVPVLAWAHNSNHTPKNVDTLGAQSNRCRSQQLIATYHKGGSAAVV
jgi:hypothetical protein